MATDSVTLYDGARNSVIQFSEQGVHPDEHQRITKLLGKLNWDDFRYVECIAKHQSIRQAAREMRCSVNTVRGRLSRIEKSLETALFIRSRVGMQITSAGCIVLRIANEMRELESKLPVGQGNSGLVRENELRIGVSEGVGTFWLVRYLSELKALLPELTISLDCFADQDRIFLPEFDLAVGYDPAREDDNIISSLAFIHMHPFASKGYVAQFGLPESLDDAIEHRCILQSSQGLHYDSLEFFVGKTNVKKITHFRVNSASSLFWAVAHDKGIASLPTYAASLSSLLVPVALPINLRFELWLSYHGSARHSKPVRTAINWLRSCFDTQKYPWFGDKFVHPYQISPEPNDQHMLPIFDQLIDANI